MFLNLSGSSNSFVSLSLKAKKRWMKSLGTIPSHVLTQGNPNADSGYALSPLASVAKSQIDRCPCVCIEVILVPGSGGAHI